MEDLSCDSGQYQKDDPYCRRQRFVHRPGRECGVHRQGCYGAYSQEEALKARPRECHLLRMSFSGLALRSPAAIRFLTKHVVSPECLGLRLRTACSFADTDAPSSHAKFLRSEERRVGKECRSRLWP